MFSLTDNILIVMASMGAALLFTLVLNRIWPVASRHTQNDLVGWQLSVLGTTYAVTLGFGKFGGADVEASKQLERIAIDHFAAEFPRDAEGQRALTGSGGSYDGDQRSGPGGDRHGFHSIDILKVAWDASERGRECIRRHHFIKQR